MEFPSTIWSELLQSTTSKKNAEDYLIRVYWRAIFHYIRRYNLRENAEDLTQDFLTRCLQDNFLNELQPQKNKGSFRKYLKTALQFFLCNRHDWENAQKRKGDFAHLSFAEESRIFLSPEKTLESREQEYFYLQFLGRKSTK